jgi:hypothetical protein
VNYVLLPEGIIASPMLMSSIEWTSSSPGTVDADIEGFFPGKPDVKDSSEAFLAAARSCDMSCFFLARSPECSSRS